MHGTSTHEGSRLATLREYQIIDTPPEAGFDRLASLAARVLRTPIAYLSFLDERRQWVKASVGLAARELPRDAQFCEALLAGDGPLVLADAAGDPRFAASPLVRENPRARFLAGMPLRSPCGKVLGALCALDTCPRAVDPETWETLEELAAVVSATLEARRERLRLSAQATALEQARQQLVELATTDPLTGLSNVRAFRQRLEHLVREGARGRRFALLLLDIDFFKKINDTYGHPGGDQALVEVAKVLSRRARGTDMVARVGGEEFALLLTDLSEADALHVAESLRELVSQITTPCTLTASLGVCWFEPLQVRSADDLYWAADEALYRAKRGGRNRVEVAPSSASALLGDDRAASVLVDDDAAREASGQLWNVTNHAHHTTRRAQLFESGDYHIQRLGIEGPEAFI